MRFSEIIRMKFSILQRVLIYIQLNVSEYVFISHMLMSGTLNNQISKRSLTHFDYSKYCND